MADQQRAYVFVPCVEAGQIETKGNGFQISYTKTFRVEEQLACRRTVAIVNCAQKNRTKSLKTSEYLSSQIQLHCHVRFRAPVHRRHLETA